MHLPRPVPNAAQPQPGELRPANEPVEAVPQLLPSRELQPLLHQAPREHLQDFRELHKKREEGLRLLRAEAVCEGAG